MYGFFNLGNIHGRIVASCGRVVNTANELSDPARGTLGLQPEREGRVTAKSRLARAFLVTDCVTYFGSHFSQFFPNSSTVVLVTGINGLTSRREAGFFLR